ncbi:MAG: pyrC, partial [Dehalococcoidia bacterium]|nr:pyrC [Dehalococcoidia bacterium]
MTDNYSQSILITGGRLIDPAQKLDRKMDLLLKDGQVSWLGEEGKAPSLPEAPTILTARGKVVCPGFIDLHCHLREPGFEEKETIATGTRAGARGGFTTLCCMPNTNPPIDSRAIVDYVIQKARSEGVIRILPIGCISQGRRGEGLAEMGELAEAGVVGYSDDGAPVSNARL